MTEFDQDTPLNKQPDPNANLFEEGFFSAIHGSFDDSDLETGTNPDRPIYHMMSEHHSDGTHGDANHGDGHVDSSDDDHGGGNHGDQHIDGDDTHNDEGHHDDHTHQDA